MWFWQPENPKRQSNQTHFRAVAKPKCQTPLQNNHSGVFLRASVLASLGRLPWLARVQCVGRALMPDKFWLFICIQHN
ncbi:hypothetical protein GCWU000324_02420 [Kingella oralis ATCC 51147]|uniref:Uncharacterized protein n=1 Tax=Kingella oralis ATCC 51147 TaxID=629741 RepID=C4GK46_9NEIS|nr:hypothetical protein GCWU000324_02420 [Kingella oralis ATCC 51147]